MTMEHVDLEILSAFTDGELDAVAAKRVEHHLADCDACAAQLGRLKTMVRSAAALPRDIAVPPAAWSEIKRRVASHQSPVTNHWWHNGWLAAAAGVVLVVGTALLVPRGPGKAKAVSTAPAPTTPVVLASVERNFAPTLVELRETFDSQRDRLSPNTVRTLEHSLAVIDTAIAEARAALASDPASQALAEILSSRYERKVEFLKRATNLSSSM